jgi:hypothetical protein
LGRFAPGQPKGEAPLEMLAKRRVIINLDNESVMKIHLTL